MNGTKTPSLPVGQYVALPDTKVKAKATLNDEAIYRFWKVEDFFDGFENVVPSSSPDIPIFDGLTSAKSATEGPVKDIAVAQQDPLTLRIRLGDDSLLLIEALRYDTVRVRWGPSKRNFDQYSQNLSRCIVMNTVTELRKQLANEGKYKLTAVVQDLRKAQDAQGPRIEWSIQKDGVEHMRVIVHSQQFSIEIWRQVEQVIRPYEQKEVAKQWSLVWSTTAGTAKDNPPLLSRKDAEENYATCFSFIKRGKLIGFGEQGGLSLLKDRQMLNIYNYDNLAYNSVYGQQALNPAEPLYHSDPFGVELNGVPGYKSAVGIFCDDYSQVLMDLGNKDPSVARMGSRFADLELHITCADTLQDACFAHSSCVGRGKLFPRWVLGYHQGCYGYDTRDKVLACAHAHRKYNIPLDGIHIDVDLQKRYRTFTIDEGEGGKFSDAKGMFAELKSLGIKASTNITPIISTQDDAGRNYWDPGNQARQVYKTLDSGLKADVFVKDRRWNQQQNPPTYTYWEGGQEQSWAPSQAIANLNAPDGQAAQYRGGVSYGEGLGTVGVYPDFGRKDVRKWWGQQYEDLFEAGLAMVWQDMTTPCIMTGVGDMKSFPFRLLLGDDTESGREKQGILSPALKINNLYSYNLHKATYHGVRQLASRKGLRNFIIGRGSFTGQHRFAGLWTGDNTSSFAFLRINIQQVLSCGIGGTVIAGADVGGFEAYPYDSQWCDPQLLIRWTLANTLLPWVRNHYMGKPGHKLFQEPYAYYENAGKVPEQSALYQAVLPICRYYITLRYTLMQLLYDAFFGSMFTGMPIARSLLATDPWDLSLLDENAHFLAQEYMAGNDILVAPIVHSEEERSASREQRLVYLPAGSRFYDFNLQLRQTSTDPVSATLEPNWTQLSTARVGGQSFEYLSSIDRYAQGDVEHLPYLLPMFVREGAVIPTQKIEPYFHQSKPNPLVLHVYPSKLAKTTTYDLYLDDGISAASAPAELAQFKFDKESGAQSDYRHVQISHTVSSQLERTITLKLLHGQYDIGRTKSDIDDIMTLQVWHDADDAQRAANASVSMSHTDGQAEQVSSQYVASLNATVVSVPVDDVLLRQIRVGYTS